MGETACLVQVQPFSYIAGIPNEAKEGKPINALGQSFSFGRFMSDSLAWEKWSSFSPNKHVEEAEKFSRPGLVAQKKAFFEEHYKNLAARKAAASLEQENAAANNMSQQEHEAVVHDNTTQDSQDNTKQESQIVAKNSQFPADKEIYGKQSNVKSSCVPKDDGYKMDKLEGSKPAEVDPLSTEYNMLVENCVNVQTFSQIGITDNEEVVKEMKLSETKQMQKPLLKDFICNKDDLTSISKKKSGVSSSKSLICGRTSKQPPSPAKPAASLCNTKENINTPVIKKSALDSMDRKKTTPKSTHKSMNFTPIREINRITSTIIKKIDGSRVGENSKASKDCPSPFSTPTTVSTHGGPRHPLHTPQSENRREETPLHPSTSASTTVRPRWHFVPTDCSKFISSARNKCQSPNLSLPFGFRTEERAARRKARLEEKFNANQAQKVKLQGTLKNAEAELKKLRQSLCFKARPLPDFYKERGTSKNQTEKVPLTHSQSPPTTSMVRSACQLVRWSSKKNSSSKHVMGKDNPNPHSLASRLNTIKHENTCPNIQHEEAM